MFFGGMAIILCSSLLMCDGTRALTGINRWLSNAMFTPGAPIPINKHDPGVQRAARFGVYRYNNMSNDIFLFKESHINKATLQVVRGLKYKVNADIDRTVCRKRMHPNLDTCDFQRKKMLKQSFQCDFEVWLIPWLQEVHVPVCICQ
ncbi:cystatin-F isoform X2 [Pogona vitticeps]|uniref:Cystatin-F isoform X2 n=1 Tax=Pogona vitticeps TaxID=103695 RepID=A0ABM5FRF2_9SAUR